MLLNCARYRFSELVTCAAVCRRAWVTTVGTATPVLFSRYLDTACTDSYSSATPWKQFCRLSKQSVTMFITINFRWFNKRGNVRVHITLRCVRVTIVTVEEQLVLNTLSVCILPLVTQHAMRMLFLPSLVCLALSVFTHYLINGTVFLGGGKLLTLMYMFWFSIQFF